MGSSVGEAHAGWWSCGRQDQGGAWGSCWLPITRRILCDYLVRHGGAPGDLNQPRLPPHTSHLSGCHANIPAKLPLSSTTFYQRAVTRTAVRPYRPWWSVLVMLYDQMFSKMNPRPTVCSIRIPSWFHEVNSPFWASVSVYILPK